MIYFGLKMLSIWVLGAQVSDLRVFGEGHRPLTFQNVMRVMAPMGSIPVDGVKVIDPVYKLT